MTPKAQAINTKLDDWNCIKLRSFCTAKQIISKVKRQMTNRVKYLQALNLIKKNYYAEYTKNARNSTTTNQRIQLRNGQKI